MNPDSWGNSNLGLDEKLHQEWLETDGLGGFASGTVSGIRTRRYHALLLSALTPPTTRVVLVNGFEATVEIEGATYSLSSQFYWPDVVYPRGIDLQTKFESQPWPKWTFELPNGLVLTQELVVPRGKSAAFLCWKLDSRSRTDSSTLKLNVRPLLSGRDYHALHRENSAFQFAPLVNSRMPVGAGGVVEFQPYSTLPVIRFAHNGHYEHHPDWYRNFLYLEERDRGLDSIEDLASPGTFSWDLQRAPAYLLLTPVTEQCLSFSSMADSGLWDLLTQRVRHRHSQFRSSAIKAAGEFLVRRDAGLTIIAGYPWFTDWGRDTFISIRGLCLATGRLAEARRILLAWSQSVSEGMLPNRFPDVASEPEYNAVDASLWFVIAVYEFIQQAEMSNLLSESDEEILRQAVQDILQGYRRGTRFGIRCDADGLLAAGVAGMALTWMDAQVGGQPVTARIGKPVEIQALWINALRIGEILFGRSEFDWRLSQANFTVKFWNHELSHLADVVDVNHEPGRVDLTLRPNQVLAIGGLPFPILDETRGARMLQRVEEQLLTSVGLRTLSPHHPEYREHCAGGVVERDQSYHQGTIWPWLIGPFIEAWVRVHGATIEAQQIARERFLKPLEETYATHDAGLAHLPEIADGDAPHTARGCPFQAWSLAEYLRSDLIVLNPGREMD